MWLKLAAAATSPMASVYALSIISVAAAFGFAGAPLAWQQAPPAPAVQPMPLMTSPYLAAQPLELRPAAYTGYQAEYYYAAAAPAPAASPSVASWLAPVAMLGVAGAVVMRAASAPAVRVPSAVRI